jgi:hypothetical protein
MSSHVDDAVCQLREIFEILNVYMTVIIKSMIKL